MNDLVDRSINNKNQKKQEFESLDKAAEDWVRLCIFSIKEKKLTNQNNNKKPYEYKTR